MFEWLKQIYKRRRQDYLISLAKKNGAYIPPTCRKSNVYYPGKKPGAGNWYTSRKTRAMLAERQLKERGVL